MAKKYLCIWNLCTMMFIRFAERYSSRFWLLSIWIVLVVGCTSKQTEVVWNKSLYLIGSQSSPQVADLNGDGVKDVVMGAGREEMAATNYGVVALDGLTGEVLWQQRAPASVVGSANFYDITGDGIQDLIIGGRGHFLTALNGRDGSTIWQYTFEYPDDPILRHARFNFYNSSMIPDQDGDGRPELLTMNGGNWDAAPGSVDDRYPGVLMIFNIMTGAIVAADTMPDGHESYMSPVIEVDTEESDPRIIFGTGGETMGGSLYVARLSDLLSGRLKEATRLIMEEGHGFIAPPSLVDLNGDGIREIVAISHAATITALDGKSYEQLWQHRFDQVESNNAIAVGQMNADDVPDLVAVIDEGVWPAYGVATAVMINGADGEIMAENQVGCFVVSSPVVYDIDKDGYDEAIISTNRYDCSFRYSEDTLSPDEISHELISLDYQTGQMKVLDVSAGFKNIFSTPWMGDLDGDAYLDIIYAQYFDPRDLQKFLGMSVKRISTAVPIIKPVRWGAYMGQHGTGIY